MWHVHECASCGRLTEGATLYLTDAPRDCYGRIRRDYADSRPVTFCSERCRTAYEAARQG